MMRKILDFFIERSTLVNVIGGLIVLIGLFTVLDMKRDLHPPLDFPIVKVNLRLPGASPVEMERLVTFPVEEAIGGMTGLKKMESWTTNGFCDITLQFDYSVDDINAAIETIRNRIMRVQHQLPKDLRPIQVSQRKMDDVFLASIAVRNMDPMNPDHRATLKRVQAEISAMNGIVRTDLWMRDRHLFIRFDADKLRTTGVSAQRVRQVLVDYFSHLPLGHLKRDEKQWSVQFDAPQVNVDSIRQIVISTNRIGRQLRLHDIATVKWDTWDENSSWFWNGEKIAELEVFKDTQTDSITLYGKLSEKLANISKNLPPPMQLVEAFDGPRFIRKQLEVLGTNGLVGFVLVLLILAYFLNWRIAAMTAWGLPIAYLGTFILLAQVGIAIDLLSIIGMILVVGVLVDDAIIVSEKYSSYLSLGLKPKEAASRATRDLIVPVTGTIVTTIVAFIPIMVIKDNLTWFLMAVPIVIGMSLLLSWFESFFILPNHLAHFVKVPPQERSARFFDWLGGWYKRVLGLVVRFRYIALLFVAAMVAGSLWVAAKKLQHHFNISIGSEQIKIYAILKQSDSIQATEEKLKPIHDWIKTLPKEEVEYSWTRVGRIRKDGQKKKGFRFAQIRLGINGNAARPVELRKKWLPIVKEKIKEFSSEEFEELTAEERKRGQEDYKKNMVSVRVGGNDDAKFTQMEEAIIAAGLEIDGIKSPVLNNDRYQETWTFVPNSDSLAQYQISRGSLASQLRQLISPDEVAQARVGGETVSVLTELEKNGQIPEFDSLQWFEVRSQMDTNVPLKYLGQWQKSVKEKNIEHKQGLRHKSVDFKYDPDKFNTEVAKEKLGVAMDRVRKAFPAFQINVGDANERDAENKNWTMKVTFYSTIGVLVTLFLFLGSVTQPFIVVLPIPLGIMGAFWALWAHDQALTLMAMIGLLGVIGVAVNDSIVMVHHINKLRDKVGRITMDKVIVGAESRLRAVFLTSLTTVAGVFPTAYGLGGESGFTQPVTFTMGWGLISSTLMTLFILPSLLMVVEDIKGLPQKFSRKKIAPDANKNSDPIPADQNPPEMGI